MNRNKILLIAFTSTLFIVSCKDNTWKEKEKKLQDSFASIQEKQNAKMESLFKNLNEIDSTLQDVNIMYISTLSNNDNSNPNGDVVESIKQKITLIKQRLATEEKKVVYLQSEDPKTDLSYLRQMINRLQMRIFEKQQEVDKLQTELAAKNKQIASLQLSLQNNMTEINTSNRSKDAKIAEMEDKQNTAYFIIGTSDELIHKGVIDKKGGFIGIGKWPVVASNSDLAIMKKIDVRNTKKIPLSGHKITVITPHNTASYSLEGSTLSPTAINIKDPALFWRTSHCLVVVIN